MSGDDAENSRQNTKTSNSNQLLFNINNQSHAANISIANFVPGYKHATDDEAPLKYNTHAHIHTHIHTTQSSTFFEAFQSHHAFFHYLRFTTGVFALLIQSATLISGSFVQAVVTCVWSKRHGLDCIGFPTFRF